MDWTHSLNLVFLKTNPSAKKDFQMFGFTVTFVIKD